MGRPYHVVLVSSVHAGGPEVTEVTPTLYGRLAKVATVPIAAGTTRRKITVNDRRKTTVILANLM